MKASARANTCPIRRKARLVVIDERGAFVERLTRWNRSWPPD